MNVRELITDLLKHSMDAVVLLTTIVGDQDEDNDLPECDGLLDDVMGLKDLAKPYRERAQKEAAYLAGWPDASKIDVVYLSGNVHDVATLGKADEPVVTEQDATTQARAAVDRIAGLNAIVSGAGDVVFSMDVNRKHTASLRGVSVVCGTHGSGLESPCGRGGTDADAVIDLWSHIEADTLVIDAITHSRRKVRHKVAWSSNRNCWVAVR